MNSRKNAGLILSGIGAGTYLFISILFFLMSGSLFLPLSLLLTGTITLIGIILGRTEIKAGGIVILISIPFSAVFMSILNFFVGYSTYTFYEIFSIILWSFPSLQSVFVIIGGIQCLVSSDD